MDRLSDSDTALAAGAIALSLVVIACVCLASCRAMRQSKANASAWYMDNDKYVTGDYGSNDGASRRKKKKASKKRKKKASRSSKKGGGDGESDTSTLVDPALVDSHAHYADLGGLDAAHTCTTGSTADSDDATSIATSATSFTEGDIGEKELLQTFLAVLADGLALVMHTSRGKPRRVKVWLEDTELMWRAARSVNVMRKKHTVDINDLSHVESGKATAVFRRTANARLSDDLCLSLVCNNGSTIDLEASSRMEREAIKQGFAMVIHSAQQQRDQRESVETV